MKTAEGRHGLLYVHFIKTNYKIYCILHQETRLFYHFLGSKGRSTGQFAYQQICDGRRSSVLFSPNLCSSPQTSKNMSMYSTTYFKSYPILILCSRQYLRDFELLRRQVHMFVQQTVSETYCPANRDPNYDHCRPGQTDCLQVCGYMSAIVL